jgi:hypothetical protein
MSKPQINDNGVLRDMTKEEAAQLAIDKAYWDGVKAEEAAKLAAKQEVLAKLGLTAEEAAILLG